MTSLYCCFLGKEGSPEQCSGMLRGETWPARLGNLMLEFKDAVIFDPAVSAAIWAILALRGVSTVLFVVLRGPCRDHGSNISPVHYNTYVPDLLPAPQPHCDFAWLKLIMSRVGKLLFYNFS